MIRSSRSSNPGQPDQARPRSALRVGLTVVGVLTLAGLLLAATADRAGAVGWAWLTGAIDGVAASVAVGRLLALLRRDHTPPTPAPAPAPAPTRQKWTTK